MRALILSSKNINLMSKFKYLLINIVNRWKFKHIKIFEILKYKNKTPCLRWKYKLQIRYLIKYLKWRNTEDIFSRKRLSNI
jgi:hypothetical protein